MTEREFVPWPKIARMNRRIVVTEKIDGTNAAIVITNAGDFFCQSRTRIIEPGATDNAGFARWAHDNQDSLMADLGPGRHFGEWWGNGIQRGYGLPKGEKRFSLFNTSRWVHEGLPHEFKTPGVGVVPVLYDGNYSQAQVDMAITLLRTNGSVASPGWTAEGIIVFHESSNTMMKVLLENDEIPKGMVK